MTSKSVNIFENRHYVVNTNHTEIIMHDSAYDGGYEVVNKEYGVVEYKTTSLPEAIFNAEQFDVALTNETWKWMREEQDHPVPAPSVLN